MIRIVKVLVCSEFKGKILLQSYTVFEFSVFVLNLVFCYIEIFLISFAVEILILVLDIFFCCDFVTYISFV